MRYIVLLVFTVSIFSVTTPVYRYVNPAHPRPKSVLYYPKDSVFLKADLIDRGCKVFILECPTAYKQRIVCARHYDGQYRTFTNYCEMEYENCNSWRQWSMIKETRCS